MGLGLGIRDWLANGDLSCLVLHWLWLWLWLSLSLSLSLRSGFSLLSLCFRLFGPPYRSGRPRGSNPEGAARKDARRFSKGHGCPLEKFPRGLRTRSALARRGARTGCVSLVTFFAQAKKVTRSPKGSESPVLAFARFAVSFLV
ncbi:conserved hypothetical protein [Xanthomonas phaseoli pv. phaseoli]|uniref:Uncharacterized protein n=1 Tax=Xanthomonas campestris pv. phaseoli TaxID=317013 RepID=A0A7Z7IZA3_XANCH|nr:conserved hypothetical protein [Xanthomonas phaseoli pv. phaseoli]